MSSTVRQTLKELEQSLLSSIGGLRSQITAMERELAEARKALFALGEPSEARPAKSIFYGGDNFHAGGYPLGEIDDPSPYESLTMKELTLKALRDQFPEGATANELLAFFRDAWGRGDVIRSSLSPQLTRLKNEGFIERDGLKWSLASKKQEAPERDLAPEGAP